MASIGARRRGSVSDAEHMEFVASDQQSYGAGCIVCNREAWKAVEQNLPLAQLSLVSRGIRMHIRREVLDQIVESVAFILKVAHQREKAKKKPHMVEDVWEAAYLLEVAMGYEDGAVRRDSLEHLLGAYSYLLRKHDWYTKDPPSNVGGAFNKYATSARVKWCSGQHGGEGIEWVKKRLVDVARSCWRLHSEVKLDHDKVLSMMGEPSPLDGLCA